MYMKDAEPSIHCGRRWSLCCITGGCWVGGCLTAEFETTQAEVSALGLCQVWNCSGLVVYVWMRHLQSLIDVTLLEGAFLIWLAHHSRPRFEFRKDHRFLASCCDALRRDTSKSCIMYYVLSIYRQSFWHLAGLHCSSIVEDPVGVV